MAHVFRRQVPIAGGSIGLVDGRQHFRAGQFVQLLDTVKDGVPFFRLELGKFFEDFGEAHGEGNPGNSLRGGKEFIYFICEQNLS